MVKDSHIIYWFREELCTRDFELYQQAFRDVPDLIPVFCFDPREEIFFNANRKEQDLNFRITAGLTDFCEKLHKQGNHVVIFHDLFEKVIPSLARVLSARKVITQELLLPEKSDFPSLTDFRNQKVLEVAKLLNLHSIPLEFQSVNFTPAMWHDIFDQNKQFQG